MERGNRGPPVRYFETATLLEKGKFTGIFFADSCGFHNTYRKSIDDAVRVGLHIPKLDPLIIAAAMATVTTNLAFGITSTTTYEPPFALARRFTHHERACRLEYCNQRSSQCCSQFGLDKPVEHDERYLIADEYLDFVYKLWESSWHDDAVKRDHKTGTALVRAINRHGKYFPDIPGPFISHPWIQLRTPALSQAGSSGAGTTFGTMHAEAVFIVQPTAEAAGAKVAEYRAKVAAIPIVSKSFLAYWCSLERVTKKLWRIVHSGKATLMARQRCHS